jgi:hypothetical protein
MYVGALCSALEFRSDMKMSVECFLHSSRVMLFFVFALLVLLFVCVEVMVSPLNSHSIVLLCTCVMLLLCSYLYFSTDVLTVVGTSS